MIPKTKLKTKKLKLLELLGKVTGCDTTTILLTHIIILKRGMWK